MSTLPPGCPPLAAASSVPVEAWAHEGAVLAGRYRVEEVGERRSIAMEEAEGSGGLVVPAIDLARGRVAIGVFRFGEEDEPASAFGALSLARSAKAIQCEHAVRVLDAALLDERTIFIVTEACGGIELGALVDSSGPLPVIEAVELIVQASLSVAEAHALGIDHGDLTPARLLAVRCPEGRLSMKVAGFGAPRRADKDPCALFFRPPEQRAAPEEASPRADLWSLGAALFYLLAGVPPVAADIASTERRGRLPAAPAALRALRPVVPVALERVVLRCLEEEPEHRYESVLDLVRALRFFLPQRSELRAVIASFEAPACPPRAEPLLRSGSDDPLPGLRGSAPWVRAAAILAVLGFAAFAGLALCVAGRSDIESALRPFQSLVATNPRPASAALPPPRP